MSDEAKEPAGSHLTILNGLKEYKEGRQIPAEPATCSAPVDEWPEPEPLRANLPPVPELSQDMIPKPLLAWLTDVAHRMNCPLDYPVVSAVVFAGSLIGSRCAVKPKQYDDWQEVPNLWGAIIGQPSMKKTPAVSAIQGVAFRKLEKEAREDFSQKSRKHRAHMQVLEKKYKEVLKSVGEDAEAAEEELEGIEKDKDEPAPSLKRYTTNDATHEALADMAAENPQGILVFRDELVGLLKQWEKTGSEGARQFFLEAWGGKDSRNTDRVGKGHKYVERLCLSLFGTIQPDRLTQYLQAAQRGDNDGLMQRFQLMIYPDKPAHEWVDRKGDQNAEAKARQLFCDLAQLEPFKYGAEGQEGEIPSFRFDNEAFPIFKEWFIKLETEKLDDPENSSQLTEHFSKYRSLMPCLALIFHLLEMAYYSDPDKYTGNIPKRHALMAIKWTDYLEAHARRVYSMEAQKAVEAHALKRNLHKLNDPFTLRELSRKEWGQLRTDKEIQRAVKELEEAGYIREMPIEPKPVGGRPSVRYQKNPHLKK